MICCKQQRFAIGFFLCVTFLKVRYLVQLTPLVPKLVYIPARRYNKLAVHPGQLLVHNDDHLFPEFQGQDLHSRGIVRLDHRSP